LFERKCPHRLARNLQALEFGFPEQFRAKSARLRFPPAKYYASARSHIFFRDLKFRYRPLPSENRLLRIRWQARCRPTLWPGPERLEAAHRGTSVSDCSMILLVGRDEPRSGSPLRSRAVVRLFRASALTREHGLLYSSPRSAPIVQISRNGLPGALLPIMRSQTVWLNHTSRGQGSLNQSRVSR